jgi:hypothetical protein
LPHYDLWVDRSLQRDLRAQWVYQTKVSGYAPGFALTVIGGESRNANTIFDHGSGALNVIGHNVEFNHWGPTFNIRDTAYSAFIGGVRIAGRNA